MLTSMFGMDAESTVQEIHQKLADEETLIKAAVKEAEVNTRELVEGESQEEIDMLKAKVADLEEANEALQNEADEWKATAKGLTEKVNKLSEEPEGGKAEGETDPPAQGKKDTYLKEGVNAEVQERLNNKKAKNPFTGW